MTDLTPNDLSHLSDAEFHALCPQGEHAPGPEPLSPAAQAILAAVIQQMYDCNPEDVAYTLRLGFRALADAVVPDVGAFLSPGTAGDIRDHILSIATELENTNEH